MNPSVYLETTIVSCLAARTSRNIVVAAHQQLTRTWWERRVRWMATATQEAYLAAVKGLATFYHRSPDQISDEQAYRCT